MGDRLNKADKSSLRSDIVDYSRKGCEILMQMSECIAVAAPRDGWQGGVYEFSAQAEIFA